MRGRVAAWGRALEEGAVREEGENRSGILENGLIPEVYLSSLRRGENEVRFLAWYFLSASVSLQNWSEYCLRGDRFQRPELYLSAAPCECFRVSKEGVVCIVEWICLTRWNVQQSERKLELRRQKCRFQVRRITTRPSGQPFLWLCWIDGRNEELIVSCYRLTVHLTQLD